MHMWFEVVDVRSVLCQQNHLAVQKNNSDKMNEGALCIVHFVGIRIIYLYFYYHKIESYDIRLKLASSVLFIYITQTACVFLNDD